MQYIHDFIASAARDAKVIEAISRALAVMELVHSAGMKVDGEQDVLDFSCEIEKMKSALKAMGVRDDEQIPPPTV